ncbi:MAG: leucine--tRNA ligase, partial [Ruminococcus sp.]|nr:leucine--tRNA ligase [Ruminococcus sp.]
KWPTYDEAQLVEDTVEIVVQINGKIKAKMDIAKDEPKDDVLAKAKADAAVASLMEGKTVVKEIYVPNKLVNIVVK